MPKTTIYLSEEEHAYFKKQPPGYLRELVQRDMEVPGGEEWFHKDKKVVIPPEKQSIKKIKGIKANVYGVRVVNFDEPADVPTVAKKGDGLNTCKKCGYMLPYYKGKCKNCGGK